LYDEAERLLRDTGARHDLSALLCERASWEVARGQPAAARSLLVELNQLLVEQGSPPTLVNRRDEAATSR
jgi:hypothetical protein